MKLICKIFMYVSIIETMRTTCLPTDRHAIFLIINSFYSMNRKVVNLKSGNCYMQLPLSLWGKPLLLCVVSNVAEEKLKVPGPQKSQLSFELTTLFRLDQNPVIHLCII